MAYNREAYLRLRANPEAWERRKQKVKEARQGRGSGRPRGRPRGAFHTPVVAHEKPRGIPAPNALPWITRERLMAGK